MIPIYLGTAVKIDTAVKILSLSELKWLDNVILPIQLRPCRQCAGILLAFEVVIYPFESRIFQTGHVIFEELESY